MRRATALFKACRAHHRLPSARITSQHLHFSRLHSNMAFQAKTKMPPSKYHTVFQDPQGPGDGRPTALQIIADEQLTSALPHKTMLITGCSSGIGVETARALSSTGCKLFLTARDLPKARVALAGILEPGRVELLEMHLDSLASVRAAAEEFKKRSERLDVLICNAGVMCIQTLTHTIDGFETQFATNHLSHFLLFNLLQPLMSASSSASSSSRVVMVSSSGHRNASIFPGDYGFEKEPYGPGKAYGQSKTANIYMANEITRRYGPLSSPDHPIFANSLMPGGIATGLQKHFDEATRNSMMNSEAARKMTSSAEQGAATSVVAAVAREWEGVGGRFLECCEEAPLLGEEWSWMEPGYVAWAFDEEKEKRLWEDSLVMVGL